MIRKSYKYRCYPTEEQKITLDSWFGSVRWVYNWGLQKKTEAYTTSKKNLSCFDLVNELTKLKGLPETSWLKECYSQSLQMSLRNLDNAYTNFFRKNAKFPKFKSKKNSKQSIGFPQGVQFSFKKNKTYLPKGLDIYTVFHRKFNGKFKTVTLSKSGSEYYISFLVEEDKELPIKPIVSSERTVGLDLGIKSYAVLSNGTVYQNPKPFRKHEKKLTRGQRILSRKVKGSRNYLEQKSKVNKIHKKIVHSRNDFLHKITFELVNDNQVDTICMEDLGTKELLEKSSRSTSKAISEVSWGIFKNLLSYKCDWYGKRLILVGRFEPSSKLCHSCGYLNNNLTLKDREWVCPFCGTLLDRDLNAAKNIRSFGLEKLRSLGTGSESKQSLLERRIKRSEQRKKELNSGSPEAS